MALKNHELCACHKEAVEVVIHLLLPPSILVSTFHSSMLWKWLKIEECFSEFCLPSGFGKTGIAPSGHNDDSDRNFIQLLKLQGEEDSDLLEWLQKKVSKYTSPNIQNYLIKLMAVHIMRNISEKLQNSPL